MAVDPEGRLPAQAFFTTARTRTPARGIEWFVWRGSREGTFEETRRPLGVETQRQGSDLAIARTTPGLMARFSRVCLMAPRWREHGPTRARSSAWSLKPEATCSDGLAWVRRRIGGESSFDTSAGEQDPVQLSPQRLERLLDPLAATT